MILVQSESSIDIHWIHQAWKWADMKQDKIEHMNMNWELNEGCKIEGECINHTYSDLDFCFSIAEKWYSIMSVYLNVCISVKNVQLSLSANLLQRWRFLHFWKCRLRTSLFAISWIHPERCPDVAIGFMGHQLAMSSVCVPTVWNNDTIKFIILFNSALWNRHNHANCLSEESSVCY